MFQSHFLQLHKCEDHQYEANRSHFLKTDDLLRQKKISLNMRKLSNFLNYMSSHLQKHHYHTRHNAHLLPINLRHNIKWKADFHSMIGKK